MAKILEKRNNKRVCIDGHTYMFSPSNEYLSSGCIYDISTTGMAVLSNKHINSGNKIVFNLFGKCTDNSLIEVNDISGEVIRTQKIGRFWLAGVLFTDVNHVKNAELYQLTA